MGLFAALMQGKQQTPQGYTYPGAGMPTVNTQIANPGQVPQMPGAPAATNITPPIGGAPTPQAPLGSTSTPGQGNMFQSILQNPAFLKAINGMMPSTANANGGAGIASGAAGIGPAGQAGGMNGADANTMRSQLQNGAPGTEMISPQFAQTMGFGGMPQGGANSGWLQQLLQRMQGGQGQ